MVMCSLLKYWMQGFTLFGVSIVGLLYLPAFPPLQKMKFEPYEVSPIKSLKGSLALNTKLNGAEKLFEHLLTGPESIVHSDGVLYTGVIGGWVVKLNNNTLIPFVKFGKNCGSPFEEHCTRPLGLFVDSKKNLYVCDAYSGLHIVNTETGDVKQLVSADTSIGGKKSRFFNSVTVASDGMIYYTISDSHFDVKNLMFSFLGDGSGRLVKYDPVTKENAVLLEELHMANGIAISSDETYLIVAESKMNALTRYFLKGAKKGISETFVDGLPGVPDNIKVDKQGNFYVSLVIAKNSDFSSTYLDVLGRYPMLRKLITQLLAGVQTGCEYAYSVFPHIVLKKISLSVAQYETFTDFLPSVERVTVVKIDKEGNIIDSLHAIDGRITAISDIELVGDYAYLGSPFNKYIARVRLGKL